ALFCWAAMICLNGTTQAASPRFSHTSPLGAQRGTEVDIFLRGARLEDAEELLLYDSGMQVLSFEVVTDEELKKRGERVKVRLKIDPTCRLGAQRMRIRTKTGLSELVNFHVGALPVVDEVEPNTDFGAPQVIQKNTT